MHVSKRLGHRWILSGVSFAVQAGECVLLTGPNGAGKSTLLKILALLMPPSHGEIWLAGQRAHPADAACRRLVGVCLHESMIYGELTAEENLRFFAQAYGVAQPARHAAAWLDRVGLRLHARDQARQFSRGMLQRLSLARSLLHDPRVLLLDEPYTGLDQQGGLMLTELLRAEKARGKSIVLVSHDLERPAPVVDRRIALAGGRLVEAVA